MSQVKKCFYLTATHKNKSYFIEWDLTDEGVQHIIDNFDIDYFIENFAEETNAGPEEGHFVIYRQSQINNSELVELGLATEVEHECGGYCVYFDYQNLSDEKKALYNKREQEIIDEVEQQFQGGEPIVCDIVFA